MDKVIKPVGSVRSLADMPKPPENAAGGFASWIPLHEYLSEEDKLIVLHGDYSLSLPEDKEDGLLNILIQGILANRLLNRLLQVHMSKALTSIQLKLTEGPSYLSKESNIANSSIE